MTAYKEAGVDIQRAEEVIEDLDVGGFGATIPMDDIYQPGSKLVMGTDGVGTKVLIAEELDDVSTIGIDLVAMCVNDVLCHGAQPFAFLDYYASGRIDVARGKQILAGIVRGCEMAGCKLVGGETAEMPGVYSGSTFDLAGFCVGSVTNENERPHPNHPVEEGDYIIGIPSSGLHSNGYSLVRDLYSRHGLPFTADLLTPTRIYVKQVLQAIHLIKSMAHITGGGIHGNLPRALTAHLTYRLTLPEKPEIMTRLAILADMDDYELESTFNCGWGMMLIVAPRQYRFLKEYIPDAMLVGNVIPDVTLLEL